MSSALRTGTVLGCYRIVAPLGAGGMAEVYRAHDTKLDRTVALKILPAEVTRDAGRVRRFVQEAKSASSLSHPNIVVVHDIGEAVPAEPGGEPAATDATPRHYIAMELVEGSTLRQLFDDRSLEPRTLLSYLAQAADGLAKAHSAGIVHRDLKPENVMVTRDGYAKVLDFGLAKLTESGAAGSALAAAPTALQEEGTRDGAVMGTIGYMSPEQAMGNPVDHRTDLFAFGCLLYEAATGRRPFSGESNVDVLHAIVREKPTPVEELAPTIPRALVRKIRRCLEKDPAKRAQSMKDLAFELHDLVEEWDTLATPSGTVTSGPSLPGAAAPARTSLGRAGWIAVAAGTIAIALASFVLWRARSAPAPASFQSMTISPVTSTGDVSSPSLSPDGRYLVLVREETGGPSLWLHQVESRSDVQLLPPQGVKAVRDAGFTPDGSYVIYTLSDETRTLFELYRMPVLGGPPRRLVSDVDSTVTFSPDGQRMAYLRNSNERREQALLVANADGSGEMPLDVRRNADQRSFAIGSLGLGPAWSPDGRTIVAPGLDTTGGYRAEIVSVEVADGREHVIGDSGWLGFSGLAWMPDGRALVVAGSRKGPQVLPQLWRVDLPAGGASRITNDSEFYLGVSVSADGRLLASDQVHSRSTLWRRSLSGPADERQLASGRGELMADLELSDDGSIYYNLGGGSSGVFRLDPERGTPVQLSPPGHPTQSPSVSRDGKTILYKTLLPDGRVALEVTDHDGRNARVLPLPDPQPPVVIHPDGTWYATSDQRGIWRYPIDGGAPKLLLELPATKPLAFSPDGARLAYLHQVGEQNGSPSWRFFVMPATGGAPGAELDLPPGGDTTRWSPDGKALVVRVPDGDGFNLWRLPLDGGKPEKLTDFHDVKLWDFVFSPDGKTLFYTKGAETSDAVLVRDFH